MKKFKIFISAASVLIFLICLYSFLLGNEVFKGKFTNDAVAWYFMAKGIFCSLALYILASLLESVRK